MSLATSQIRSRFLGFLGSPPVMDLIRDLTAVSEDGRWRAWDDDPRASFGAILSPAGTDAAPLAWARLLLPWERGHGSDPRCACLVLYAEPRARSGGLASPAALESWCERFNAILGLPAALTAFLAGQLALTVSGDPPAEAGLWLTAPRALTELVDPEGLKSVPGPARPTGFTGLAVADAAGGSAIDTALAWLREMCDSALHLDDYEPLLAHLATRAQPLPIDSPSQAHRPQRGGDAHHHPSIPRGRLAVMAVAAIIAVAGLLAAVLVLTPRPARSPALARPWASWGRRWIYRTRAGVLCTPAIAGGAVYVADTDGTMYALKASNGRLLWTTGRSLTVPASQISNDISARPAVAGSSIYVSSWNHNVYALNARTGHVLWTRSTGDEVTSSPAVADGVVYIGSKDSYVYALNASNGDIRWTYRTLGPVQSSPAVTHGTVYVGSGDGKIYALNARTGHVRWAQPVGPFVLSSPLVAGGVVYAGSGDTHGDVYALDARTGHVRWIRPTGRWIFFSSPVLADGIIYIGSTNGEIYAINAATGHTFWKQSIGKPTTPSTSVIQGSPAVSAGTVYIGNLLNGKIYALNARTGQIEGTHPTGGGVADSPAVDDSLVYIGNGSIYALKTIKGTASP